MACARQELLTTPDELASCLGDARLRIIDCRFDLMAPEAGRRGWLEAHVPGALYADLDRDLSGPIGAGTGRHPLPAIADAEATFSRLGIDADTRVVAYDDANGAIASRAWWLLRWLGHRHVTVLDGGLQAWRSRGLPLESGAREAAPRSFRATVRPDRVLTTAEIAANLDARADRLLLDVRDAARFRGEVEPIDTRAGHIPGTRNLPFGDCLGRDGTWLGPAELRDRLEPLLGKRRSVPWAVMCGSGVTACHLVISGLLAGYSEPRVYVGSWSEWIRDASRPIARAVPQRAGQ
jgi:thiosulfate/3-mercaptopyruvate sulfurtransferase